MAKDLKGKELPPGSGKGKMDVMRVVYSTKVKDILYTLIR